MNISSRICFYIVMAATVVSCGDDKKETTTATTAIKYSEVSALIATNCATSGCHNAASKSGSYDMSSRTAIATKASSAAARMELASNPMPPTTATAQKAAIDKDTTGKANLIAWLKAGAPE